MGENEIERENGRKGVQKSGKNIMKGKSVSDAWIKHEMYHYHGINGKQIKQVY